MSVQQSDSRVAERRKPLPGKGRAPDELGSVYGRLTVIAYAGKSAHRDVLWLCRCECGAEKVVMAGCLRSGNSRSCGCYRSERSRTTNSKAPGVSAFNKAVSVMMANAARRGVEWLLPLGHTKLLMGMECHYCGAPPANRIKTAAYTLYYNGIDRVDNSLGYVPGNVVPCCIRCNTAKSDMTITEFRGWIDRLFHTFIGK